MKVVYANFHYSPKNLIGYHNNLPRAITKQIRFIMRTHTFTNPEIVVKIDTCEYPFNDCVLLFSIDAVRSETRSEWQSLACSPPSIAVSPLSE